MTYQRSQKGAWASLTMWTWTEEAIRAYDFQPHWQDDGEHRTLMLMGPDSPRELCLRVHKRWLRDATVQWAGGEIVLWMDRCGRWLRGEYAPDVVPAEYRS